MVDAGALDTDDCDIDDWPTTADDSLPSERGLGRTQPTLDRRAATRLRNTEQWLLEERTLWRAERKLLEDLIRFKDDDLEENRQRLAKSERQTRVLWNDLKECWSKLLQRRKLHDRLVTDNIRLQAKNSELRMLIAQMGYKNREQEQTFRFQCLDTEF